MLAWLSHSTSWMLVNILACAVLFAVCLSVSSRMNREELADRRSEPTVVQEARNGVAVAAAILVLFGADLGWLYYLLGLERTISALSLSLLRGEVIFVGVCAVLALLAVVALSVIVTAQRRRAERARRLTFRVDGRRLRALDEHLGDGLLATGMVRSVSGQASVSELVTVDEKLLEDPVLALEVWALLYDCAVSSAERLAVATACSSFPLTSGTTVVHLAEQLRECRARLALDEPVTIDLTPTVTKTRQPDAHRARRDLAALRDAARSIGAQADLEITEPRLTLTLPAGADYSRQARFAALIKTATPSYTRTHSPAFDALSAAVSTAEVTSVPTPTRAPAEAMSA